MKNGLDKFIKRSGISKREVARLMGVTPETVSRHIHGKVQFNTRDAQNYAVILGCYPNQVMFDKYALPIFGVWEQTSKKAVAPLLRLFDPKKRPNIELESVMVEEGMFGIVWDCKDHPTSQTSCLDIVRMPKKWPFDDTNIQRLCYALTKTNDLVFGNLYPRPNNRVDLINEGSFENFVSHENLEITWAAPLQEIIFSHSIAPQKLTGFSGHFFQSIGNVIDTNNGRNNKPSGQEIKPVTIKAKAPIFEKKATVFDDNFKPDDNNALPVHALLSVKEAGALLWSGGAETNRKRLVRLLEKKVIKGFKDGNRWYIPRSEIERLASGKF